MLPTFALGRAWGRGLSGRRGLTQSGLGERSGEISGLWSFPFRCRLLAKGENAGIARGVGVSIVTEASRGREIVTTPLLLLSPPPPSEEVTGEGAGTARGESCNGGKEEEVEVEEEERVEEEEQQGVEEGEEEAE